MNTLLKQQQALHDAGEDMLANSDLLTLLNSLGEVVYMGSYVTGLMAYPDIDITIQNTKPDIKDAIELIPRLFKELGASKIIVADFKNDRQEPADYYIGFKFAYQNLLWNIDATATKPYPIIINPKELSSWFENMTETERVTILRLKKELIDSKRYVGAQSQPPYTFRSVHLYEGVLKGNAKNIYGLEEYFKSKLGG